MPTVFVTANRRVALREVRKGSRDIAFVLVRGQYTFIYTRKPLIAHLLLELAKRFEGNWSRKQTVSFGEIRGIKGVTAFLADGNFLKVKKLVLHTLANSTLPY